RRGWERRKCVPTKAIAAMIKDCMGLAPRSSRALAAAHAAREPDQGGADQGGDDADIGPTGLEIHHGAVRIGEKAGAFADRGQSEEKNQKADNRKRNSHDCPLDEPEPRA